MVYFNSFRGEFVFDDVNSIIYQENIKNTINISEIWNNNKTRFIPYLTFALNYHLDKYNPVGYHIVNFVIHILNAFLVFLFVRFLQNTPLFSKTKLNSQKLLPFLVAILFTVHPIQTQAVNFISQRSALFAAFFYLSTLILYLKRRILPYLLSLVTLVLALISKENSYTLALSVVFCDFLFFPKKRLTERTFRILPYFLITFFVFALIYLRGQINPVAKISSLNMLHDVKISRGDYMLTQINVMRTYLRLMIMPVNQNIDYDFPVSRNFPDKQLFLSALIIIGVIFTAVKAYKKNPLLTFGVFLFFIAMLIESSIIPIKDVIFEHRLYLPTVGFFLAISSIIVTYKNKKYKYFFITIIILLLSFLTFKRNIVWQSEYNLWKDASLKSPKKSRVHYNLGVASYGLNKFEEAKNEFKKTINLDAEYSDAYKNLGAIYEYENKDNLTLELFRERLKDNPQDSKIGASLASFYTKKGKYHDAESVYLAVLKYDPDNPLVYNDLGIVFFIQNKKDEAIFNFKKAVQLNPKYENAIYNLANTYYHFGDDEKARVYYSRLLKINPESAKKIPFTDL